MGRTTNRERGTAHQTRETDTRAANQVHEEGDDSSWVRGASLEMPPARPGMDQRWIRFATMGKEDATNFARKMREGWSPRRADTVKDDFAVPSMDTGRFAGAIVVEGMVLCERPLALSRRRDRHFRNETQRRTEAINADLQRVNSQNRSPAFGPIQMATQQTRVREVAVADD